SSPSSHRSPSPSGELATDSGDVDVFELPTRRLWRQRKQLIGAVAAAALIAVSVLVGQGMSGGAGGAEAAAGEPRVETATGGVTPEEMGQVDLWVDSPATPVSAPLDTEEIIAAYPPKKARPVVTEAEVRRAAARGPTVAEVVDREVARRASRSRGPAALDRISEAIDRSARARVDSLERAAQTPTFERSREIPD
ncbi:MAG TPA: hypothetical protein VFS05_03715, partial [Gemmatimonadaceae bacterium]|nr:hypothetical protein [Gemmatimonadaceae bacterium]